MTHPLQPHSLCVKVARWVCEAFACTDYDSDLKCSRQRTLHGFILDIKLRLLLLKGYGKEKQTGISDSTTTSVCVRADVFGKTKVRKARVPYPPALTHAVHSRHPPAGASCSCHRCPCRSAKALRPCTSVAWQKPSRLRVDRQESVGRARCELRSSAPWKLLG